MLFSEPIAVAKIASLEDRVRTLEREVVAANDAKAAAEAAASAAASADKAVPVTQSKQFVALKAMLDKKNAQLTDARRRLSKYEPDEAGDVDDDGGK